MNSIGVHLCSSVASLVLALSAAGSECDGSSRDIENDGWRTLHDSTTLFAMSPPLSILDYKQPVEFRIGDVVVRSWNVLSRHLPTFSILTGAALLPQLLLLAGAVHVGPAMTGTITFLTQLVLATFAHAIVIFAAFQDLRGRRVSAGESISRGLVRFLPAVAVAILSTVVVVIGLILLIIPGLLALAALSVAIPVCVVEQGGPVGSLSRSAELTRGYWWHIIAVFVAIGIIQWVVAWTIRAAIPAEPHLVATILAWLWGVFHTAYSSVFAAMLYHDLRASKEGIGIDEIAAVFD
jgi:hypothetical protein